jgi:hypothetical protein
MKTQKSDDDVDAFLESVEDEQRRSDAIEVRALMADITGDPGAMWGTTIVGFGENTYLNGSGKSATWFQVGFSPRKQQLVLYIMDGFDGYDDLLGQLGKHSTGKSCLYIKRLDQVDRTVLRRLIEESVAHTAPSE